MNNNDPLPEVNMVISKIKVGMIFSPNPNMFEPLEQMDMKTNPALWRVDEILEFDCETGKLLAHASLLNYPDLTVYRKYPDTQHVFDIRSGEWLQRHFTLKESLA